MKKIVITLFAAITLVILPRIGFAATTLAPGQLFIITVNSDDGYNPATPNSNGFDFITTVDLDPGTVIYFTDKGWDGSLATPFWRNTTGEGLVRYTVPAGGLIAGTVVRYHDPLILSLPSSGSGTWDMFSINPTTGALTLTTSITSGFDPSTSGDNILVFQDPSNTNSAATPNFIYGMGWSTGTTWISSGTPSANNSWAPTGISAASNTLVSLGSIDNYQYNCAASGLFSSSFASSVLLVSNWYSNDTVIYGNTPCTFDATQPTLISSVRQTPTITPTNTTSVTFRVTFSEDVTGVDVSDFLLASGSLTATISAATLVSGSTYDVIINGYTGNGTLNLDVNPINNITDIALNPLASSSFSGVDETYTIDTSAPIITNITLSAPSGVSPNYFANASDSITLTFDSNEEINLVGSTIQLAGQDVSCTPPAVFPGTYTCTLATTAIATGTIIGPTIEINILPIDSLGNAGSLLIATSGTGTGTNVVVDKVAPTPIITAPVSGSTVGSSISITGTCELGLTVTLAGAGFTPSPTTTTCSDGTFSVSVTVTGNVTATVSQTDAAGNAGTSIPTTYILDAAIPTLNLGGPTTTAGPFTITITSSESITGLTLSDITVTNGTASNLIGPDGSGNYTVTITPTTPGIITVQIPAGSVVDGGSNTNTAASNTLTINYSIPTTTSSSGGCLPGYPCSGPVAATKAQIVNAFPEKMCPHFTQYLKRGDKDGKKSIQEVKKVQKFLNMYMGSKIKENGIFDTRTINAVNSYQKKFSNKILTPWGLSKPTGRWYQSTRNLANSHVGCPEGETILDNGNKVNNI